MKKLISLTAVIFLMISAVSAQKDAGIKDPAGKWKFEAPYAPEGFTAGTIEVGNADGKYSATMAFTASGYSLTGENVVVRNDSLYFMVWVEGTEVNVGLGMDDNKKMTGNAVHFEGSVPLTLTKEEEKK